LIDPALQMRLNRQNNDPVVGSVETDGAGVALWRPVDNEAYEGVPMATRQVSIASSVGLHARPASLFVQAATATGLAVTIAKEGGNPVDARSILMVMALGAKHGETVTITADGDGAEAALDSLVALLARDLDAE
jgi:phosphocarrier protein HPr